MDENWITLTQDYRVSGLTAAKWCEEKGFKVHWENALGTIAGASKSHIFVGAGFHADPFN